MSALPVLRRVFALPCPRNGLMSALFAALLMTGCSKPVEKAEEIRPVRAMVATAGRASVQDEFSGEVRARIESRLGFRVGGKLIERKVDVGAVVEKGQVLARLDPQDLQLAQAQTAATVNAAQSNRDLAQAELKRYQDLRAKNFVSQALLDAKQAAFLAAQSSLDQALAAMRSQSNQTGYAVLIADTSGVVTAVEAEAGHVVAAGSPVVRIAQTKEKEVVIGVPEDRVDALRQTSDVRVRTWAQPDRVFDAIVREVSPVADPATRTYTFRVAVPDAPEDLRLGMTAYVTFSATNPNSLISIPMTALVQDKSSTAVWIVENGAVRMIPVAIAGASGNEILIANGLMPGQTVVTAGVHMLKPGQKVSVLASKPPMQDAETDPRSGSGAAGAGR